MHEHIHFWSVFTVHHNPSIHLHPSRSAEWPLAANCLLPDHPQQCTMPLSGTGRLLVFQQSTCLKLPVWQRSKCLKAAMAKPGTSTYRRCDDRCLARLEPVHACEDVDGVGGEDDEGAHVGLVEHAQVDGRQAGQQGAEGEGDHHGGGARVGHEEGEGGEGGEDELAAGREEREGGEWIGRGRRPRHRG